MIVVDACVWIDYFNGTSTPEVEWLTDNFEVQQLVLPDIIALEVLRGFKLDKDFKAALNFFKIYNVSKFSDLNEPFLLP